MIVYVVTYKQIEQAFLDWVAETDSDDRKIMHTVFNTFMMSEDAKLFHTVTHLISFPFDKWELQFRRWSEKEIARCPDTEDSVRMWTDRIIHLLSSTWCIDHKLVVKGCLDEFDNLPPAHVSF